MRYHPSSISSSSLDNRFTPIQRCKIDLLDEKETQNLADLNVSELTSLFIHLRIPAIARDDVTRGVFDEKKHFTLHSVQPSRSN